MRPAIPRVVLLGSWSVGKTSLINRIVSNKFNINLPNTTGAGFFQYKSPPPEEREFQIWDTAGMERFRSLNSVYYQKASAGILVFDLTRNDSFKDLESWRQDFLSKIKTEVPIILVGNKCDKEEDIEVDEEEVNNYAKDKNMKYFQASACTGKNVREIIDELIKLLPQESETVIIPVEEPKSGCC